MRNKRKIFVKSDQSIKILLIACISRLIILSYGLLSSLLVGPYDSASYVSDFHVSSTIEKFILETFKVFANWDGVYFWKIATEGYVYEQDFAFFPGMPLIVRALSSLVSAISPFHQKTNILLSAILLSNTCFVLTSFVLYKLSIVVLKDQQMAFKAAVLFCFNPASIFMSSFYTESLYAFTSFAAMLIIMRALFSTSSVPWEINSLAAALLFAISSSCRSNGLVAAVIFLAYDFFSSSLLPLLNYIYSPLLFLFYKTKERRSLPMQIIISFNCVCLCLFPFAIFQYYGYKIFCSDDPKMLSLLPNNELRPWCFSSVPNMYSFIQAKYWKVGFLAYFEFKQLPNFLLASPMIIISTLGIYTYVYQQILNFKKKKVQGVFLPSFALPFMCHWCLLLVVGTFVAHVQVITRLIAAACPAFYWFSAYVLTYGENYQKFLVLFYFIFFFFIGPPLFCNFYPWT